MQMVVPYEGGPEDYLRDDAAAKMVGPDGCPNCGARVPLMHHGYYERYVSSKASGEVLRIRIKRLRCHMCRLTTSLLPWFSLPYRLIRGEAVARFLRGDGIDSIDLRWQGLLDGCRKRFRAWRPELSSLVRGEFGIEVDAGPLRDAWLALEDRLGALAQATRTLVTRCGVTLFGRYQCHLAKCGRKSSAAGGNHTPFLFSKGRSPPS